MSTFCLVQCCISDLEREMKMIKGDNVTQQIGRLHFQRNRGQSILIYPKAGTESLLASTLFDVPVQFTISDINDLSAKITVSADTRLCVVRNELEEGGKKFSPPSQEQRMEAQHRVFVALAQEILDPAQFDSLVARAKAKVMLDTLNTTLNEKPK